MTPRADKPKTETKPTTYEISRRGDGDSWTPIGLVVSTAGARAAIRKWADAAGDTFPGGPLRAVPTSRITEVIVTIETKRQLTLGAP